MELRIYIIEIFFDSLLFRIFTENNEGVEVDVYRCIGFFLLPKHNAFYVYALKAARSVI